MIRLAADILYHICLGLCVWVNILEDFCYFFLSVFRFLFFLATSLPRYLVFVSLGFLFRWIFFLLYHISELRFWVHDFFASFTHTEIY